MRPPIPLKGYLSLHFGLVAVLPVIIIACLIWFVTVPTLENRTESQNQAIALSMADQISVYLGGGKRQMTALVGYIQNQRSETDTIRLLDAQCGRGEYFEALYIIDFPGTTIRAIGLPEDSRRNRGDFIGLDLSGRRFISRIKDLKQPAWSKTILSTVSNRMAVTLSVPLNNGFLIGEVTLAKLSEYIRDLPVESELRTMVMDGEGIIVADSQKRHWGERLNVNFTRSAGPGEIGQVGSAVFMLEGQKMLGSLVKMDAVGWSVLAAQPVRRAFQPVWDTFTLIAFGLAVGLVMAISISWFLAGKLAQIFSSYAQRAKDIADGRYQLNWPAAEAREFYQLSQSLQLMAQKIQQREKELIDGEQRLKDLLVNVPGVVYQFVADFGNLESYSSAGVLREKAKEILGLDSKGENYFNEFIACLPQEDRPRFFSSVNEAVENFLPWYYQGRFIKPSGQEIWIECNSTPSRVDGKVVFYGLITDITQRKEMQSSLHLTQFCFDKAAIGIHHIGEGGRILNVNEYAAQMLGYTMEEMSGLSILEIDPYTDFKVLTTIWEKLVSQGMDTFEATHRKKDGALIPVEITATILEYEGQQFSICFVQDITERKQMEKAIKESQERLDLALSGANEGIWDWHIDEDTVYFDDRYYIMAGYEPNEFPGSFHEFEKRIHTQDVEAAKSIIDQYLAGERKVFEMEFRFLRKDNTYMWIQAKGKIVDWDSQGNPARFIGTHADITVRKQAEEALRENEQLLANILESMDEGVLVLDHEFKYQIVNRKLETLGASRDKIMGKTPWEAFPYIKGTIVEERMRNAMKGQVMSSSEIHLQISERESVWSRDSFSPLRDANGRVIGVVGMVNDITRQKQDEEELRQLRSYLTNIIDSMPSILVAVDREEKVTLWNNRTEQATGLRFHQALSQPLPLVFPRLAKEMEQIRTALQESRVIRFLKVPSKSEDEVKYEDITIFPLVANGMEGAVIRVDDVTEQVRMEEMMIQSEKMLSVGGLAAGMAHEINNPLAGMLQTASVISNRLNVNTKIPANQKAAEAAGTTMEAIQAFMETRGIFRMLTTISESGQRVSSIVENMLSFARKGDSQILLHHLEDLIDRTLELAETDYDLKKQYDFKRVNIVKEYGNLPFPIPCEGGKIQQVLLNIFRNGAQAMQMAGIQLPCFIIRTRLDVDMACIEIEDNGPGMDETTRKRAFEPFFTTKAVGEGTGLGLSVSYFIITQNHGGKMEVESKPGAGTKFIICLPVKGMEEGMGNN